MKRKDFQWDIPDIEFSSNPFINIILIFFLILYYVVLVLMYFVIAIVDLVKLYKTNQKKDNTNEEIGVGKTYPKMAWRWIKEKKVGALTIMLIGVLLVSIHIISRIDKQNTIAEEQTTEQTEVATNILVQQRDSVPEKDSIDIIIEQRAKSVFVYPIFAGLKFGDSPLTVARTMEKDSNRVILVPNGDRVSKVHISATYKAEYYNDGLASLTLFSDDVVKEGLKTLFATKYGLTKQYSWNYANCSIEISTKRRREHNPSRDNGYRSGSTGLYYDTYDGGHSRYYTKSSTFLVITYKNNDLLKKIEWQKQQQDSIKQVQRQREIDAERELAKKLATEPATNI